MRLICPNCDAQYDIADDVIPLGGRDVQCSSCAHTWFQTDKPAVPGRKSTGQGSPATPATPSPEAPPRRALEPSIADILREEAAHEEEARRAENEKTPATPEAADKDDADETRRRIAQMTQDEAPSPAAVAAAATGAVATDANLRTVPGIDEINATLRARAEAADTSGLTEAEKQEVVKRRGFRRGFFFVLLLIAILIAPYFFVEEITEALPQTQDFMNSYVETVDRLRVGLDVQIERAREFIDGLINAEEPAELAPVPEPTGLSD